MALDKEWDGGWDMLKVLMIRDYDWGFDGNLEGFNFKKNAFLLFLIPWSQRYMEHRYASSLKSAYFSSPVVMGF